MLKFRVFFTIIYFTASFILADTSSIKTQVNLKEMSAIDNVPIDGSYLKAFGIAYKSFLKEPQIKSGKKNIINYSISFSKSGDTLNVTFAPKLASGEEIYVGGEGLLGRAVEYQISSKNYKVLRRLFFK